MCRIKLFKNSHIDGQYLPFHNVCQYLSIPYAKVPARFAKPQPLDDINEITSQLNFPPSCPQHLPDWARHMMTPITSDQSEDCLFLNIWTRPSKYDRNGMKRANPTLKPTLVWIHGGGYQFGSSSLDETNGTVLASNDIAVITLNYRLNAFGFLSFNQLDYEGNMGLYDQAEALNWINKYGSYFGLDSKQVTLAGQGMGSMSISAHFVSPFTRHLFNRAIMTTGSIFVNPVTYSSSDDVANVLIESVGCSRQTDLDEDAKDGKLIDCLRSKKVEDILNTVDKLNAINPVSFIFNPDDEFFNFTNPVEMSLELDKFVSNSSKQILFGFNADEGSLLIHSLYSNLFSHNSTPTLTTFQEYRQILLDLFVDRFHVPRALIRTAIDDAVKENMSQTELIKASYDLVANNVFVCPTLLFAEEMSSLYDSRVYGFVNNGRTSYNQLPDWFGTIHNEEVPMMFGFPTRYNEKFSKEEIQFSERMVKTIAHFVQTG